MNHNFDEMKTEFKKLGEKRKKCEENLLDEEYFNNNKKVNISEDEQLGKTIFDYFPYDIITEIGVKYLQLLLSEEGSKIANRFFLKFILLSKAMNNQMKISMTKLLQGKDISYGEVIPISWGIQIWTIKNELTSTLVIPYWREKFEIISKDTLDLIKEVHILQISPPSLKFISNVKNIESLQTISYDKKYFIIRIFDDDYEDAIEKIIGTYWQEYVNTSKISHLTVAETFKYASYKNLSYLRILSQQDNHDLDDYDDVDDIDNLKEGKDSDNLKELVIEYHSESFLKEWLLPSLESFTTYQKIDKNDFGFLLSWIIPKYLPKLKYICINFDQQTTTKEEFDEFKQTLKNNNPNLNIKEN